MSASPGCVASVLSVPPLRGAVAVLMLLITSAVAFVPAEDLGLGIRLAFIVVMLLLGAAPWAATLSGFVTDLARPTTDQDARVLALRRRGPAVVVSWIALVATILAPSVFMGAMERATDHPAAGVALLAFPVALLTAAVLPKLSRWYTTGAGTVSAGPGGLVVELPGRRTCRTEGFERIRTVGTDPHPSVSLPGRFTRDLGRRVRWLPGAREAVARWSRDGFAPTAGEVHELGLDPAWSPDPFASSRSRDRGALIVIARLVFALLVGFGMMAGSVVVAVDPYSPRWAALLLLVPALAILVLLGPRLVRVIADAGTSPVRISPQGWIDQHHRQGRVSWSDVLAVMVDERWVCLVTRPEAKPFRDPDLANRANAWIERKQRYSPVRIPSAGPGYRTIDAHVLVYPPESGVWNLLPEAERIARPHRRGPLVVIDEGMDDIVAS